VAEEVEIEITGIINVVKRQKNINASITKSKKKDIVIFRYLKYIKYYK